MFYGKLKDKSFQADTGTLLAIEMMRSQISLMNSANLGLNLELDLA